MTYCQVHKIHYIIMSKSLKVWFVFYILFCICLIQIPKKPKPESKEEGECSESSSDSEIEISEDAIISSGHVPPCDSSQVEQYKTKPNSVQSSDINDDGTLFVNFLKILAFV